jgi:Domain of Unknown Function (DUF1080)
VTVQTGGKEEFTVRFVPLVVERQQKQKEKADARRANADEHPTPSVPPAVLDPTAPAVPASRTAVQPSPAKRLAFFPAKVRWGTWTISSNEVLVRGIGRQTRVVLTPNAKYENAMFEAEVKRIEGNGRIQLELGDDDVNFLFYITIKNNLTKAHLAYWGMRSWSLEPSPDPQWVGAVDNDKWDSLKIAKEDGLIKCYFNNKEIISAKDDRVKFGRLALATANASARFRNIKVRDAGGRVLLEGLPDLPIVEE